MSQLAEARLRTGLADVITTLALGPTEPMLALDTHVLVRVVTNDDPKQAAFAR